MNGLRPRLLFLCHRFPYPPNRGDRIRSYNQIRVLSESFDVTLACPHDEVVTEQQLQHMRLYCSEIFSEPVGRSRWGNAALSAVAGRSLTEGLFSNRNLKKLVVDSQQSKPYDSVFVFCSSMFPYVDDEAFSRVRKVIDLVDVDSMKWEQLSQESTLLKRPIYALESRRVKRLEERLANEADAVVLVSESEAGEFRGRAQTATPIEGVSNGVDTDYFYPKWIKQGVVYDDSASSSDRQKSNPNSERCSELKSNPAVQYSTTTCQLVFTGVLDYPPNVEGMRWFCREILPKLRQRLDVTLNIVGRRPSALVKQLSEIEGVVLVGEVPDVRPYSHAANIAISPLTLARGIQNKVLEAMACGLPVVSTTQSAEGIDAVDGHEIIIANTVDEWIEALVQLAGDSERRDSIGRAARQAVVQRYSWQAKLAKLKTLVAGCELP